MKRPPYCLAALLTGLLVLSPCRAENEDPRLASFFKKYLDEEFRRRPLEATQLGDHRFDQLLDDLSPRARADWTEFTRKALRDLPRSVAYGKLSRSGQIDFEILEQHLTRTLWLAENTRPFETDPRTYNEYINDGVFLLLAQSTLPKPLAIKSCIARMAQIPRVVATARRTLDNPPRVFVETAIAQNRGAIAFYERDIYEAAGQKPEESDLVSAARPVLACLKEYQKFLEKDLLPRAQGEWRLGRKKFVRKLQLELDAGLTADQVLRDAQVESERVRREMYVVARQLWARTNPGRPLPPDDPDGRRATILRVFARLNQDHDSVKDLVRDARAVVAQVKGFIRANDILRLPEPDHCRVMEMPEFQRGNTVAYLNPAPPLDARAASIYAISPPPQDWDARRVESYLLEYNQHMLPVLTIHEAYPGHYVQLAYSSRHPSLVRRVLTSGVFAEGWAVYTEQMMLDQGYGDGDLALRLNQLKFYLRAVMNAILDHQMHCGTLTDPEALAFLTQDGFQTEGEALGKIVRAKQSSCQLSTYFVGRMAFYRLRQKVEREQGDRFELGRYHEAVLAHGTVPVKYLPELVPERLKQPR